MSLTLLDGELEPELYVPGSSTIDVANSPLPYVAIVKVIFFEVCPVKST